MNIYTIVFIITVTRAFKYSFTVKNEPGMEKQR